MFESSNYKPKAKYVQPSRTSIQQEGNFFSGVSDLKIQETGQQIQDLRGDPFAFVKGKLEISGRLLVREFLSNEIFDLVLTPEDGIPKPTIKVNNCFIISSFERGDGLIEYLFLGGQVFF